MSLTTITRPQTFRTFVTGPQNALAYNAALTVARAPGTVYNPLLRAGGAPRRPNVGRNFRWMMRRQKSMKRRTSLVTKLWLISPRRQGRHGYDWLISLRVDTE